MNDQAFFDLLRKDRAARRKAAWDSFSAFFGIYFGHYIKYKSAPFHEEIFRILQDPEVSLFALIAFRGSGKSTIVSLAYVLWAIMCSPQMKFVVLVGMTQEQVRQLLKNIRTELENNELLRNDLGPFHEEENEWRQTSLVLESYGARIMAVSVDQSVRGLRHREHRPGLIVCDDLEDLQATTTREGRDKTARWFTGELLPMGDITTRTIVIGNLLHDDALLRRIKRSIESKTLRGVYCEYPLLDADGNCLWPGKFSTSESIECERQRIGNEEAWQREFLLRLLPDVDQVVMREWVKYYDVIPQDIERHYCFTAIAIDPAVSQKSTADCTAIVCARVYYVDGHYRVYMLPHPVNARLSPLEVVEKAKFLSDTLYDGKTVRVFVEDVAAQHVFVELCKLQQMHTEGIQIGSQDKRARLSVAACAMQAGRVFFPTKGADLLIEQLVGFPRERFDDLADAFSLLVNKVTLKKHASFGAAVIYDDGSVDGYGSLARCSCGPDY